MTSAVVLGGGFAGVLAATVLARHVGTVTLVESGRHPAGPVGRPGLPQGHHSHVLAAGGVRALDAVVPGAVAELLARGAHRRDLPGQTLIRGGAGWFRRHETGGYVVAATRWLMDDVFRRHALTPGPVTVRENTRVLGLVGAPAAVTGVVVRRAGSAPETIRADLVVDATGRASRADRWLLELGAPPVREETVDVGLAYTTRLHRVPERLTAVAADLPAVIVHPGPGTDRPGQGATLFPVEDGRWIVTLTGTRGSEPPADEAGVAAFLRQDRFRVLADLLAGADPVTALRSCRSTTNRRRYFERGPRPAGFLVLGDALVAVNPVYSHGMSVAALGVARLAAELEAHGPDPAAFRRTQIAMAMEAEPSWRLATQQDRPSAAVERTAPDLARRMVGDPALMTALFRRQLLLPTAPEDPVPAPAASTPDGEPPATTAEAVAQYPALAQCWRSDDPARRGVRV